MGFTFDDTDTKGVATSLAEMRRLIEQDPRNAEVIFPYIGGEEVIEQPDTCAPPLCDQFRERERGGMPCRWPELDGDR